MDYIESHGEDSGREVPGFKELVDSFEEAWQSGTTPSLEAFMSEMTPCDPESRRGQLTELVAVDLEYRWRLHAEGRALSPIVAKPDYLGVTSHRSDSPPRLEDYLSAFSELGAIADLPVELISEEYRVRHLFGDQPEQDEYIIRFGQGQSDLVEQLRTVDTQLRLERTAQDRVSAEPSSKTQFEVQCETTINPSDTPQETKPTDASSSRFPTISGYEILSELGRGGMGVVYRARQVELNRVVALKMLRTGTHATFEEQSRFRTEAESVARLQHPNIVQIFEVGDRNGQLFFSMEYVARGNLSQKFADNPLFTRAAAELLRTLAMAVEHAHQHNIIHRDLKPANVLLTEDGTPKIGDFGLAKRLEEESAHTRTGDVMGTPSYMAPEQAVGSRDIGPATDVYALGAILYEMLTGQAPFKGKNAWETVSQVIADSPLPPSRLRPSVPGDLDTICLKCLEKTPTHRYASARELADELDRWLTHKPIVARRVGAGGRALRWTRRHPSLAGLISVLLTVSVGLAVAGWQGLLNSKATPMPDNGDQFINSLGMSFANIPDGQFEMGMHQLGEAAEDDQLPLHTVQIRSFYMGVHEVTVKQFRAFVKAKRPTMDAGTGFESKTGKMARAPDFDWQNPGWKQNDNLPVVNVSWENAVAFCDWLSLLENRTYRLPTEAEWEYACRAGSTTVFFCGNEEDSLQDYANVADASLRSLLQEHFEETDYFDYTKPWNDGFPFTAPVGQFKPNAFGLYDMHGNVQEWCSDWYGADSYAHSPSENPRGPESGSHRVKRGGDWVDYASICRSSFRRSEVPPGSRCHFLGFRIVCEVEP